MRPSPSNSGRERDIFLRALDYTVPTERAAFIAGACGDDAALRTGVEGLLQNHREDSFLESSTLPAPLQSAAASPVMDAPSNLPPDRAVVGAHPLATGSDSASPPDGHHTGLKRLAGEVMQALSEKSGDTIGRYKLLEKLGEGGFGVVYMAEQREPVRRKVALKIIKVGMDTREVVVRFEAERQALALMDHPNIAKVLDGGATDSGRPYFVMELVRGTRITDFCDQNRLSLRERLDLFLRVCHAVQHAHQKGIIHRDLKPSNILVTINDGAPVPKIIDFGIAKATQQELTEKTLFTAYGQFLGTPAYMSPEQTVLTSLDIDTRADIYSLGVLLYELLTGRPPFDTQELLKVGLDELCRTLREVEPPRPSTRLGTLAGAALADIARTRQTDAPKLAHLVRGDLDWIVMKALEKDRRRRYETANDLAADIRRHLDNEPVAARAPSLAYRWGKFARRNKLGLTAGAIVAGILVTATGVSIWQAQTARRAEAAAVVARNEATAMATAERAAREESDAFANFLTSIFGSPNPKHAGRRITVAETLDRAVKSLDVDLAGQPARQARLRATLGLTYYSLGLPRDAIPLLENARDFYRAKFGRDHTSTLHVMGNLANSYLKAGRRPDALRLMQEVLAAHRQARGEEHPDTLTAMGNMGNVLFEAGQRREALALREKVLALRRQVSGREHPDTLLAMGNLALSFFRAGRRDEAISLMEEALTVRRKVSGAKHPDTIAAMNNLAMTYSDASRGKEATELMEKTLAVSREALGPEHPDTLDGMNNLSILYFHAGRREDALKLREEVLPLRRKVLGPEHPDTLGSIQNLAVSYADANRPMEALKLREESLPLFERVQGPEDSGTLLAKGNLANSYHEVGRQAEALALRETIVATSRTVNGTNDSFTQTAMNNLALSLFEAGRQTEALAIQEEVVAYRRRAGGPEHRETLEATYNLAKYYAGAGRKEEALTLKLQVLTLMGKVYGPEHPTTLRTMMGVGIGYREAGRTNEAVALGLTNVALFRRVMGAQHIRTLNAATELAISHRTAGQLTEAIALEDETLKLKRQQPSPNHPSIVESLENLAACYELSGRKADAEALRKELAQLKPVTAGAATGSGPNPSTAKPPEPAPRIQ